MKRTFFLYFIAFCFLMLSPTVMMGNGIDSSQLYTQFIKVSSNNNQLPIKMDVTIKQMTKLLHTTTDSAVLNTSFYLSKELVYLKFGELEQFVNDSMMLVVNDQLQQMIIYEGDYLHQTIKQVSPLDNTEKQSYQQLANKYSIDHKYWGNKLHVFELNTRSYLPNTHYPKETCKLVYDSLTLQPKSVWQIKRQLIPINQIIYFQMLSNADYKDKVFMFNEDEFFALQEVMFEYQYNKVSFFEAAAASFKMNSRIQQNAQLEFMPVSNYANYSLYKN